MPAPRRDVKKVARIQDALEALGLRKIWIVFDNELLALLEVDLARVGQDALFEGRQRRSLTLRKQDDVLGADHLEDNYGEPCVIQVLH